MKTEGTTTNVIWTGNVDLPHLTSEECLPVIGSCHVSSIFSHIESPDKALLHNVELPHNMELIVLNNDYKEAQLMDNTVTSNNYIVLKGNCDATIDLTNKSNLELIQNTQDLSLKPAKNKLELRLRSKSILENLNLNDTNLPSTHLDPAKNNLNILITEIDPTKTTDIKASSINSENLNLSTGNDKCSVSKAKQHDKKKTKKSKTEHNDDILLVHCDLCPFLCLDEAKVADHIENVHKNREGVKQDQIMCPACPNIFHHKISLRTHLLYDHHVSNADLGPIMQAIVNNMRKNKEKTDDLTVKEPIQHNIICKEEFGTNFIINTETTNTEIATESSDTVMSISDSLNLSENLDQHSQVQVLKTIEPLVEQENTIVTLPMVEITTNNAAKMFNDLIKQETKSFLGHKCLMCKTRMMDINKLNYHIKCHSESFFKCPECSEVFSFWKPLTGHLWRSHKIDMELYSCDKCDYKSFSLAKLTNIHKLIHGDVRGYPCDVCDKAFKNAKQLRNHKITHKEKTDVLTFYCESCAKPFYDRRQLRVHMDNVHKKLKPFLCSYCGYKGSSKTALKMHIRQHTGEKPFSCDSCKYTTGDHNSLRRHKLQHSGLKPYKCSHCDYACIQSSTYKIHLKTKHPGLEKDLLFSCQECQFKTINRHMYSSHVSTVHKHNVFN